MEKYKEIDEEVESLDEQEIMDLMKKVIAVNTIIPPGKNYDKLVEILEPYFNKIGYSTERVTVPEELVEQIPYNLEGPRINLVAIKEFEGNDEYVSFYGHMDVVPAPNEGKQKWRFDPLQATMIKSGKIYGRGVADMKGSIVCMILALQLIHKLRLKPKYNIRALICTDEEIGIWPGVRYLNEKGYVKGIIFCMEGVVNPILPIGAAGALNVIVETIGRSCHSGMNFMGVNALEEMVPILVELMKLKKVVEERESDDIPGFPRFGTGEQRNMTPMFNLDMIKSGEKPNIVPDVCKLTINRRLIPEEKYEDVKREIQEAVDRGAKRSKALDVKTTFIYDYPAVKIDPNSYAVTRVKKVISKVQDIPEEKIQLIGMSGSTDMGYLDGYDILIRGTSNPGSNAHGVNETIKMNDVKTFIKEIIAFLCLDL
ncbi:MAG: M20 family peptidase [Promethearchaeota archaeon]|nr:MAG: M20 family peptidase [Candidatus Lokiarchaeota archaeon]